MSDLEYVAADFADWYIWEIIVREFPPLNTNFMKRAAIFHWLKTGSSFKYDSLY